MNIRILSPEDFTETPWRNGGGVTRQLAIHPPEATVADPFMWRISSAKVAGSGPFSPFPGMDRTLLLLEGSGLRIDLEGMPSLHLDQPLVPVSFSGDVPAAGHLEGAPCLDFNVFTRRTAFRHAVEVIDSPTSPGACDLLFAYAAVGAFNAQGLPVAEGSALQASEIDPSLLLIPDPGARTILIRIHHI